MSADWKAGDLALSIADSWYCGRCNGTGPCDDVPVKGRIYRVSSLLIADGDLMLTFDQLPSGHFHHSGFRKIRPDVQPADDAQWVEQLKHLRRKVPA